jgi:hypothetical protein
MVGRKVWVTYRTLSEGDILFMLFVCTLARGFVDVHIVQMEKYNYFPWRV